jgi:hypothetical protein
MIWVKVDKVGMEEEKCFCGLVAAWFNKLFGECFCQDCKDKCDNGTLDREFDF